MYPTTSTTGSTSIQEGYIGHNPKPDPNWRSYKPEDYRIIFAGLFIDPPGSSVQYTHSDVSMADRDALWNITLPFEGELREPYVMARSESGGNHRGGEPLHEREACIWDAGWPHKGTGNTTHHRRVLLHLALAPYWMVSLKVGKDGEIDFGKLDDCIREDLLHFDKVTPTVLQHLHGGSATASEDAKRIKAAEERDWPAKQERVQIYWDGEDKWFSGVVKSVSESGKGLVRYDDGETSDEDFNLIKWRLAPSKIHMPHSSIAKEYNNGLCIHDPNGEIITWVDRVYNSLPRQERDAVDRKARLEASNAGSDSE